MKPLWILICSVALGCAQDAFTFHDPSIKPRIASGPSYLASEGFEGTGAPSGWASAGTPNWDDTTSPSPLVGSQSLSLDDSDTATVSFTAASEGWIRFRYNQINTTVGFANTTFELLDSGTQRAFFRQMSDGTIQLYAADFTPQSNGTFTQTSGQTNWCWVYWKSGTGTDAIAKVYFSSTSTRPGTADAEFSAGDWTSTINQIRLYSLVAGSTSTRIVYDEVIVSATEPL